MLVETQPLRTTCVPQGRNVAGGVFIASLMGRGDHWRHRITNIMSLTGQEDNPALTLGAAVIEQLTLSTRNSLSHR